MNYNTYDVAVMNYPLFDKSTDTNFLQDRIFKPENTEEFEVPIYIHIPFCDSLCNFCIYNRIYAKQNSDITEKYTEALIREIKLYSSSDYIGKFKIGSVFIGGGTPTVLNENQLYRILKALRDSFNIDGCEMTVECNAANADLSKLRLLSDIGVTRVSTGIQTLDDKLRKELNIQKESKDVLKWIEDARRFKFKDVSVDLIYGFPGGGKEAFLKDVKEVIKLDLNHISIYKLAVFAYTKLYKQMNPEKKVTLPEDSMEDMFYSSHDLLQKSGYEIQSAQEYGKEHSRVKFWDLTYDGYGDNISLGSSSFGYINGYCCQNEDDVNKYINKTYSILPISRISPRITKEQMPERTMIMGFRRGFVLKEMFYKSYKQQIKDLFKEQIVRQINEGLIYEENDGYYMTPKGFYNQGLVSAEYMISIFKNTSPLKKKLCIGSHEMP